MKRMTTGRATTFFPGLVVMGLLTLTSGWGQAQDSLQNVEQRLTEKRTAAEAHRKQMEGIKDPEKLSTAMRRHFQMTEEVLALMLERQKLLKTQASATPTGQSGSMQGGGMMGHGMGMMQKEMGGMQGGGMQGSAQGGGMQGGGMMQKEMGGMQGGGMQGGGMQGGGMQGMGGTSGTGTASPAMPGMQTGSATPSHDMAQMLQRIAEHSTYMETLKDQATLTQEMLRHQKMLDEMLQLMQ